MKRVIVKTVTDITANLEADCIEYKDNMIFIQKGSDIVGIFDIGAIQFVYKTQSKGKENEKLSD